MLSSRLVHHLLLVRVLWLAAALAAQEPGSPAPAAVAGAGVKELPKAVHPVEFFSLQIERQDLRMAYREVRPTSVPNGRTVLLLHGKNFSGFYWERVIRLLASRGFPDTKALLDHLGMARAVILGHSMGGMLGTRFTLMYPGAVEKLVLEDPIGLEDYRSFVPYASVEELYKNELNATYQSFLNYQKTYYTNWKPEYEQYVRDQAWVLGTGEYPRAALASALTSEMVYEQPVCYEFSQIMVPTLLIIGQEDRTVPGQGAALAGDAGCVW